MLSPLPVVPPPVPAKTTLIDLGVVRFAIDCDDAGVIGTISRIFQKRDAPVGSQATTPADEHHYAVRHTLAAGARKRYSVECNGETLRDAVVPSWLIPVLAGLMSDQLMDAFSRRFDTLHAGAVAMGDCGILIPGESHSGKSTTSAILALAGFRFYTDDVAIFDDDLRLIAHPRAIMLRDGGRSLLKKTFPQLAPERLIAGTADSGTWYFDGANTESDVRDEHAHVRLILLQHRDPNSPTLVPISRSEVIPVLVSQCFGMASDPAGSLETIIRLVSGADCYTINMHDPLKAVDAVNRLVERMA